MSLDSKQSGRTHFPWLEYLPEGGDRVKATQLDKDIFTIGRADTADIQIDSARVSREHARIIRSGDRYLIHDLKSTNGTFVNGKRISESQLTAGDVIVVADTEFAFLMDSVSRLRRMKTQQMTLPPKPASREGDTSSGNRRTQEAVRSLRAAHERLCQGFTHLELASILEYPSGAAYAHLEHFANGGGMLARQDSPLLQPPCHALIRQREVHRFETVRRCAANADCTRIIVPVEAWEIHEVGTLVWHFEAMSAMLARNVVLFASVPASAAVDLPEVQKFCGDLQTIGIEICCHDFTGSGVHVESLSAIRPQLLLLANEMTGNAAGKPQFLDRLTTVVGTSEKIGAQVVATGNHNPTSLQDLANLGIELFLPIDAKPTSIPTPVAEAQEKLVASACH